jgi:hypothetical protein
MIDCIVYGMHVVSERTYFGLPLIIRSTIHPQAS